MHPTRDAVAVEIVRVRQRDDLGVGHGVQQPESEHVGRGAAPGRRRARNVRLGGDREGGLERGGYLLLHHLAPNRRAIVAHRTVERGRVGLDVFAFLLWVIAAAPADDRILVARSAPDGIEQRSEPVFGRELDLEYGAPPLEQRDLVGRQAGQRVAGGRERDQEGIRRWQV